MCVCPKAAHSCQDIVPTCMKGLFLDELASDNSIRDACTSLPACCNRFCCQDTVARPATYALFDGQEGPEHGYAW